MMTAVEHIIAWIESSRPEYDRLLQLERERKAAIARHSHSHAHFACEAFGIAVSAYRQMVHSGDAWAGDHSPATILDAAKALLEWELE